MWHVYVEILLCVSTSDMYVGENQLGVVWLIQDIGGLKGIVVD